MRQRAVEPHSFPCSENSDVEDEDDELTKDKVRQSMQRGMLMMD